MTEEEWPHDLASAVFLGRAAEEVGRAMFGFDWTGREFNTKLENPIPQTDASGLVAAHLHRIHWLLHQHRPERNLPTPSVHAISRLPPPISPLRSHRSFSERTGKPFTPSPNDIEEARAVVNELNAVAQPMLARRERVVDEIMRACEATELATAYLEEQTGNLQAISAQWWRGQRAVTRFELWWIDANALLRRSYGYNTRAEPSWIYVDRSSLADFVRAQPFNKRAFAEAKDEVVAQKFARQLSTEPAWRLDEALLWIGLRDVVEIARFVIPWRREFSAFQAGSQSGMVAEVMRQRCGVEPEPTARLMEALRCGNVVATGCERGLAGREKIPLLEWIDLKFLNGPSRFDGEVCAFDEKPNPEARHFWARVTFDKESVVKTFPPDAADAVAVPLLGSMEGSGEAWHRQPDEKQNAWVLRPEVQAEANRRADGNSRAALARAFADMAPPNLHWKATTLEAVLRERGVFPNK